NLADVAALSPTDVWFVGQKGDQGRASVIPVVAHWNGRSLDVMTAFRPSVRVYSKNLPFEGSLTGIAAISATDIWAVGTDGYGFEPGEPDRGGGVGRPVVEHWDGRRWHSVPTPHLPAGAGRAGLSRVAALSSSSVWAVGQAGNRPLAEHWDGHRWKAFDMF